MAEESISIKRDDGKIHSPIRNKWLVETPEERVRQEFVTVLVNQYGYEIEQLGEEEKRAFVVRFKDLERWDAFYCQA